MSDTVLFVSIEEVVTTGSILPMLAALVLVEKGLVTPERGSVLAARVLVGEGVVTIEIILLVQSLPDTIGSHVFVIEASVVVLVTSMLRGEVVIITTVPFTASVL